MDEDSNLQVVDVELGNLAAPAAAAAGTDATLISKQNGHQNGFGETTNGVQQIKQSRQVTLVFKNLSKFVPVVDAEGKTSKRQILFDVSGVMRPKEVTALMGPSGSGKTTLLNTLGGRATQDMTGEILINNHPYTKSMRRLIAYVLQSDIFFGHLTVREQLTFTAQLRLPRHTTEAQKKETVQQVIKTLNIERCANTPIYLVSGGEKKRTNIGTELLTNPSVLLLDEPTSGLDSTTAAALVSTLRTLANTGKTVISSIHQPSSQVFYSFDRLILLADGHMVYSNSPTTCLAYLATHKFVPPADYNPADFVMDLVNSMDLTGTEQTITPRQHLIDSWDNAESLRLANAALQETDGQDKFADTEPDDRQTYLYQLSVLLNRAQKNAASQLFTTLNFVQCFGVAIISGLVWYQMPNNEVYVSDKSGFIFFFMTFWLFNSAFQGMMGFPPERAVLMKERASGAYNLSAYFLAKTLSEAPVRLILPTLYLIVSYWMAGLNPSAKAFFSLLGAELTSTLTGESIGLFIGTVTMDIQKALVICTVSMLGMLLVGGFFVKNIPFWLKWIKYVSPFYYCYDASLQFEYSSGRHVYCVNGDYLPECKDGREYVDGAYVTSYLGVSHSPGFNLGMLWLMLVGFRVLAYLCLRFLNHNQGRR